MCSLGQRDLSRWSKRPGEVALADMLIGYFTVMVCALGVGLQEDLGNELDVLVQDVCERNAQGKPHRGTN